MSKITAHTMTATTQTQRTRDFVMGHPQKRALREKAAMTQTTTHNTNTAQAKMVTRATKVIGLTTETQQRTKREHEKTQLRNTNKADGKDQLNIPA